MSVITRLLSRTLPAALLAVAAGCGGGGGGGKARSGGPDPAKVIAENTAGAARNGVLQCVQDRLRAAQARREEIGGPLDAARKVVEALQRDGIAATGNDEEAFKRELARANEELNRQNAKLGHLLAPMDKNVERLNELRKRIEAGRNFAAWEVAAHQVEAASEKTPDERTSVIEIKLTDYKDVLGEALKLRLTWRKSVQTLGFGQHKDYRILWELRRAELVPGPGAAEGTEGK